MISVVVPTYNHSGLLPATLDSVFAQAEQPCEVIVVNDGSSDNTREALRPLAEAGRIVYIEQQNRGQAAARNRGLQAARGEFVAFLDDDDLWPPDRLEWQAAVLRENPQAVLVYGRFAQLRPDGELRPDQNTGFPSGRAFREFRRRNWIHSVGQTLMRTAAVRAIGGFDPQIWGSDDWDLYIRLAQCGTFEFRDRIALHYRFHEQNASRNAVRHTRNHFRVVRRHIGWNIPLLIAHQRAASAYFVPNLVRRAAECHESGDHAEALRACAYALAFQPGLLRRAWVLGLLARSLLRLPRRSITSELS